MSDHPQSKPTTSPFEAELQALGSPEERLRCSLEKMRAAISCDGRPDFRTFWDVRRLCMNLFKEGVHPAIRAQFWTEYSELSAEARHLKDHFDQESKFAAEQIGLAIQGMEAELAIPASDENRLQLPAPSARLEARLPFYGPMQAELGRLSGLASRVNGLRKELMKTEMRIGLKTGLFRRLSAIGDQIFPPRKKLILEISKAFLGDVTQFVGGLQGEQPPVAPSVLRDEIRAFQALAKLLTINSQSFREAREKLSASWERVREWDKSQHQERREIYRATHSRFIEQIAQVDSAYTAGGMSSQEAADKLEQISRDLRETQLGGRERRSVRERLSRLEKQLLEQSKRDQVARLEQEKKKLRASATAATGFLERISELLDSTSLSVEAVRKLGEEITQAKLVENDQLRVLARKEVLDVKLLLSREDMAVNEALLAYKQRRVQVKQRVELLRRQAGGSGLDFESAMRAREVLNEQKQLLRDIDAAIGSLDARCTGS